MVLRRTAHAVYDTKYHWVWAPKYRKWIKREDIRERVKEIFLEVAEHYGFEVQERKVAPDPVHIFLSFPPRYSIAHVVEMLKSISASEVLERFPGVKEELWGGEFWEDGYFARTVGDKITAGLIKCYIKYHRDEVSGKQLKLFKVFKSPALWAGFFTVPFGDGGKPSPSGEAKVFEVRGASHSLSLGCINGRGQG